jgi:hypothetical protein
VNEYLKLAANADKQQRTRIKTVFEKKNQKSAHNILQLQKKLDSYTKKLRNYEMNGAQVAHRQPREVLRDMGQGSYVSYVPTRLFPPDASPLNRTAPTFLPLSLSLLFFFFFSSSIRMAGCFPL